MAVSVGSVVRCLNGRDSGRLLVVVGAEGGYLLLADGKRRKADRPKRKKAAHIADTGIKADYSDPITNKQLKKALNRVYSSLGSENPQR